jgi:hypothetical protein
VIGFGGSKPSGDATASKDRSLGKAGSVFDKEFVPADDKTLLPDTVADRLDLEPVTDPLALVLITLGNSLRMAMGATGA